MPNTLSPLYTVILFGKVAHIYIWAISQDMRHWLSFDHNRRDGRLIGTYKDMITAQYKAGYFTADIQVYFCENGHAERY